MQSQGLLTKCFVKSKISKVICFDKYIACGYDDGLILVWSQKVNSSKIGENDCVKPYVNIFSLDYVFIGHTQIIVELFFLKQKNYLISSSQDGAVKFFDMTKGHSLYHFSIDSQIHKMFFYTDNKKNEFVSLVCTDAFKINVNITKQPFTFLSSSFNYNIINSYSIIDKNYFCTGKKGNLYLLDHCMTLIREYTNTGDFVGEFLNITKWRNYYILLADDLMLHFTELIDKTNKIVDLFRIPIGKDNFTDMCLSKDQKLLIIGSADKSVYKLNIEEEFDLYWNRNRMINEEKDSIAFNNYMKTKGSKKKKPAPKKGGSRGVSANKSVSKPKENTATSKKSDKKEKPKSDKTKRPESAASIKSSTEKQQKKELPVIKEKAKKESKGEVKKLKSETKTDRNSKSVQPSKKKK